MSPSQQKKVASGKPKGKTGVLVKGGGKAATAKPDPAATPDTSSRSHQASLPNNPPSYRLRKRQVILYHLMPLITKTGS